MRYGASEPSRGRSSRGSGLRSPAERPARTGGAVRAVPHRTWPDAAQGLAGLSGRLVAGAPRAHSGAALDRPRGGRLAAAPDLAGLVGPRARLRPLDNMVCAPGGTGPELRGQRLLAALYRGAPGRGGAAQRRPP